VGKEDPVKQLEQTHGHLNQLVLAIAEHMREHKPVAPAAWDDLVARLDTLRDELLTHFADEEEALFPFVRSCVPTRADVVDRLESAHDTICGSVVRLVHLAKGGQLTDAMRALHERFESAYAEHSVDEARLFEELDRVLDAPQRQELTRRLRGL
jgi:iron-sulfur cluster repair protein YtfE (RIC family)